MLRIAFVGFRHGHIMGLYSAVRDGMEGRVRLVGACEEDPETAAAIRAAAKVQLTHSSFAQMLSDTDCDAIAVGDYFARRGSVIIAALKAKKHVIADKPICTRLSELEEIAKLARENNRRIGCLLDLRDSGVFRTARQLIRAGAIGEVLTITFTAQHPLLRQSRPKWYFEPNKHGGTVNDIGIHAIDLLPWVTGRTITRATAARTWNARCPDAPSFHDCGQLMLQLDNNGSILGDFSYSSPDGLAYTAAQYWRVLFHGTSGMIEASYAPRTLALATNSDKAPRYVELEPDTPNGCLDAFIREIEGIDDDSSLTTTDVLDASRRTLLVQSAADQSRCNLPLE